MKKKKEGNLREQIEIKIEEKKVNLYDKYILNTEILSNLSNDNNRIKNLEEDNNIIGRIFYKENNEIGYYELFKNDQLNLINNVSEKIIFLHPPSKFGNYDKKTIFGFRYYKNGKDNLNDFFTLINAY